MSPLSDVHNRIARCSPLSREALQHATNASKAIKAESPSVATRNDVAHIKNPNAEAKMRASTRKRSRTKPAVENQTVQLLDLPTEMLAMISDFLAGSDLLSLRLSHSLLSAAADDAFARTFFQDRKHLLTNESLDALVEICRRPNWVRKMQHLQFCVVELDRQKYSTAQHRTRGAKRRGITYGKFMEETHDVNEIQARLEEIMDALWDVAHIVEIEIMPAFREDKIEASWGLSRLMKKLGAQVPLSDLQSYNDNSGFTSLMMAFSISGYYPNDLDCFACRLNFRTFDSLLDLSPSFPETWSCLHRLDLGFTLQPLLRHAPHTSALEKFFVAVTSLSTLGIYFHDHYSTDWVWSNHGCIKWLAETTSHMRLDNISLHRATAHVSDLVALAAAHGRSLRWLDLKVINLPGSECWSTFFASLEGLELEYLVIKQLRTGCIEDDDWRVIAIADSEIFEIEGKEEVTQFIEQLA